MDSIAPAKVKTPHRPRGDIAELPKEIRDQLNDLLRDGFTYAAALEEIGAPVSHISEDSIGRWFRGPHKRWLAEQDQRKALAETRDSAIDISSEKATEPTQEAARALASAGLYKVLSTADPHVVTAALGEKPELYLRVVSAVARLSEGAATAAYHRALATNITDHAKSENTLTPDDKLIISQPAVQEIIKQSKLLS